MDIEEEIKKRGLDKACYIRTDSFVYKNLDKSEDTVRFIISLLCDHGAVFKVKEYPDMLPHVKVKYGKFITVIFSADLVTGLVEYSDNNIKLPAMWKRFPFLFKDSIRMYVIMNCRRFKEQLLMELSRMLDEINVTRNVLSQML